MNMENYNEEKLIRHWIRYNELEEYSPERKEYYWAERRTRDPFLSGAKVFWLLGLDEKFLEERDALGGVFCPVQMSVKPDN